MTISLESLQTLIQQFSLLNGFRFIQLTVMTYQAISKAMETKILTILISIVSLCFRCVQ